MWGMTFTYQNKPHRKCIIIPKVEVTAAHFQLRVEEQNAEIMFSHNLCHEGPVATGSKSYGTPSVELMSELTELFLCRWLRGELWTYSGKSWAVRTSLVSNAQAQGRPRSGRPYGARG